MSLLAVYGTLGRFRENHHELNGAEFIGLTLIAGHVVNNRIYGGGETVVELYEVYDFEHLDAFEAPEYERVHTKTLDGISVWVYV